MPLIQLNPLNIGAFSSRTKRFIECLTRTIPTIGKGTWHEMLSRYSYDCADVHAGEAMRVTFNNDLRKSQSDDQRIDVANRILEWGGMDELDDDIKLNLPRSFQFLDALANGQHVDLNDLYVRRLASVTKLYEMWDLDHWIIYDSYCVRGLQWLVSEGWKKCLESEGQTENVLRLPWPRGRVGRPLDGFRNAADNAPLQKRLGFIYGSWLCKSIAEMLNEDRNLSGGLVWRAFHVEMVAFQLGHEVD